MPSITDLPTEILLHIFHYYLETETQKSLIKNIAKVCLDWKNICYSNSLWTKFDGSLPFGDMMKFCEKGSLSNTRELIVSRREELKSAVVNKLFPKVKNIEVLSFANVEQLSKDTLSIVANNCTKLKEIQIGRPSKNPVKLNYEILGPFFAARGNGIVKINLSHSKITNFRLNINCISDCCPNLEYLHLTDITATDGTFPTKYLQLHCPKLKGLHLDKNIRIICNSDPCGFANLEVFSYFDQCGHTIDEKGLECILFNSANLKFLNLTNCDITATVLCALPACSVEYLYIPRSKVCNTNALSDVLKKWSHSLKEVDISYGNSYAINKGIFHLVKTPEQSPLEYLNLSFTKVIALAVEEILSNCNNLEVLNLEGCRNLGRGMKTTYRGKNDFANLSAKLKALRSAHPELVETIDIC